MPELPEVETIVSQLNKTVKNQIISDVWTDSPKNLKGKYSFRQFRSLIKGKKIKKIQRKGKNIFFYLDDDWVLWIHLKLTGHLLLGEYFYSKGRWQAKTARPLSDFNNGFIHWVFKLKKDKSLALSDMRKFAKIALLKKEELKKEKDIKELGQDPLKPSFKEEAFEKIIRKAKGEIKKFLMDQRYLSGIGNIYANEILWSAKVNPFKKIAALSKKEISQIFISLKEILNKAIKNQGTSAADESYKNIYGESGSYNKFLRVYQREGQPCFNCGTKIKRIKSNGRSTFYCPKCQKMNNEL